MAYVLPDREFNFDIFFPLYKPWRPLKRYGTILNGCFANQSIKKTFHLVGIFARNFISPATTKKRFWQIKFVKFVPPSFYQSRIVVVVVDDLMVSNFYVIWRCPSLLSLFTSCDVLFINVELWSVFFREISFFKRWKREKLLRIATLSCIILLRQKQKKRTLRNRNLPK